jgi:hypothetical protein
MAKVVASNNFKSQRVEKRRASFINYIVPKQREAEGGNFILKYQPMQKRSKTITRARYWCYLDRK